MITFCSAQLVQLPPKYNKTGPFFKRVVMSEGCDVPPTKVSLFPEVSVVQPLTLITRTLSNANAANVFKLSFIVSLGFAVLE
jgi:hypothetical protein